MPGTGSPNRLLYSLITGVWARTHADATPTPSPNSGLEDLQLLLNPGFESGNVSWVRNRRRYRQLNRSPGAHRFMESLAGRIRNDAHGLVLSDDYDPGRRRFGDAQLLCAEVDTAETTTTTQFDRVADSNSQYVEHGTGKRWPRTRT
jgi:hypothetical protein